MSPAGIYKIIENNNISIHYGDVAQLGEHQVRNLGVEGSNPFVSTKYNINISKAREDSRAFVVHFNIKCEKFLQCYEEIVPYWQDPGWMRQFAPSLQIVLRWLPILFVHR